MMRLLLTFLALLTGLSVETGVGQARVFAEQGEQIGAAAVSQACPAAARRATPSRCSAMPAALARPISPALGLIMQAVAPPVDAVRTRVDRARE